MLLQLQTVSAQEDHGERDARAHDRDGTACRRREHQRALPTQRWPPLCYAMSMVTAATTHFVSEAEFLALPESNQRIELIDGEIIVPPSLTFEHQVALGRLFNALSTWSAQRTPPPTVALAPLDVRFGANRILQPDLMVFLQPLPRGVETPIARIPELVIEVLSNNRSFDRFTKRALYAEANVVEYWLVDLDGARIEVRTGAALSGERFCTDKLSSPLLPDFVLEVAALFA